jgi:hypothetical protein
VRAENVLIFQNAGARESGVALRFPPQSKMSRIMRMFR